MVFWLDWPFCGWECLFLPRAVAGLQKPGLPEASPTEPHDGLAGGVWFCWWVIQLMSCPEWQRRQAWRNTVLPLECKFLFWAKLFIWKKKKEKWKGIPFLPLQVSPQGHHLCCGAANKALQWFDLTSLGKALRETAKITPDNLRKEKLIFYVQVSPVLGETWQSHMECCTVAVPLWHQQYLCFVMNF